MYRALAIDTSEGMKGIPEGKVLKLMKSLYGLKQSPMNFNNTINEFIESMER